MKYEIEIADNGGVVVKEASGGVLAAFAGIVSAASWIGKRHTTGKAGNGWLPHNGGPCPVHAPWTKVEARFRSADTECGYASEYKWSHIGSFDDIIAYRVVSS